MILPEFQGRGFASEAAAGLVEYAFTKLAVERLLASTAAENGLGEGGRENTSQS